MLSQYRQTGRMCEYNAIKIYLSKTQGLLLCLARNNLGNTNTSTKSVFFDGTVVKVALLFFFFWQK